MSTPLDERKNSHLTYDPWLEVEMSVISELETLWRQSSQILVVKMFFFLHIQPLQSVQEGPVGYN